MREKYEEMEKKETRWESFMLEDASLVVVAFGSAARVAKMPSPGQEKPGSRGITEAYYHLPFSRKALEGVSSKWYQISRS